MFPPEAFGIGVTVAALHPAMPDMIQPAGVVERPSRLGELLPVERMTPEQKAANLQLVAVAESQLAAFKAELVVGLAADRPATDDRRSGRPGAASGEWAAELLDASVSEFFPDELALIQNCSRTEATVLWERSSTLMLRLPRTWAALADGEIDWPRVRARQNWAGRRATRLPRSSPRSRGWCSRGPPVCRSPGSGRSCARNC